MQQFPARQKTALDHPDLKRYAKKMEGGDSAPTWIMYLTKKTKVRIDVYNGIKGDGKNGNGLLRVDITQDRAQGFLEMLKECAKSPEPQRRYISVDAYEFFNGQRSEAPKAQGKLVVGRAEDGRLYHALQIEGRPCPVFYHEGGMFYKYLDQSGNREQMVQESNCTAIGYIFQIQKLIAIVAADLYEEANFQRQQPGGGRGGYQGGNNGGGGYQGGNQGGGQQGGFQGGGQQGGGGNQGYDTDLPM